MNNVINQMLSKYNPTDLNEKKQALKEVIQEVMLCALSRAGFFNHAAFYGGTALRIFHGLDRFSEDLDFSLKYPNKNFQLSSYFSTIENELKSYGLNMKIEEKDKSNDSNIKSAFLKGDTLEHMLYFYSNEDFSSGTPKTELIKIKFEIDTNPPDFASFEKKYQILPNPYRVTLYDMPSLFAGKIHAILCRDWKNRIKGRDLYDYIFFMQKGTGINLDHLKERLIQSNRWVREKELTIKDVQILLEVKFEDIDYENAKEDVKRFIKDESLLDIWCAEFFIDSTKHLKEDIKIKQEEYEM